MTISKKLWIGMAVLIVLSPVGLLLPEFFDTDTAWGEWSADELAQRVGYIPQGFEKLAEIWDAPMPDYALHGQEEAPMHKLSLSYILSAVVGIAVTAGVIFLLGKALARNDGTQTS